MPFLTPIGYNIEEVRKMVFSFDVIIVMMVICYVLYAYKAGLHSQIRIFLVYIAPLIVLYFLAKPLTLILYKLGITNLLRNTIFIHISSSYANTLTALVILMLLYVGIIFASTRVFKLFIRESTKEKIFVKLGRINRFLSVGLGVFNFYVLIYIVIVPAGIIGVASFNSPITGALIEYAPPFSRWGRVASSTSGVTSSVDSFNTFSDFFTGDSLDIYYETVFAYQKDIYSKEDDFYNKSFDKLTSSSQEVLKNGYKEYYGVDLTDTNYHGIYRILLDSNIYDEVLSNETKVGNKTKALTEAHSYVKKYEGLVVWFADEDIDSLAKNDDFPAIINSFKDNYIDIAGNLEESNAITNVNDFYLAIRVYDTFNVYLEKITSEMGYPYPDVSEYDIVAQSTAFISFISKGNNMSYLIESYYDDYQVSNNDFELLIDDLSSINELGNSYLIVDETLDKTFELSERYVTYYIPIINYLDPEISAIERIAIAAIRTEIDMYGYMSDVPVFAALVNDVSLLCKDTNEFNGVTVCESGNLYTAANIISSAYIMNNAYDFNTKSLTPGYYDENRVTDLVNHINKANKRYIYTDEFIKAVSNQIAFNETEYMGMSTTLLDYMIDEENLFTKEGLQVLIDYASSRSDLFSQQFVDKLIAKKGEI